MTTRVDGLSVLGGDERIAVDVGILRDLPR
jgi:hypothetical protein